MMIPRILRILGAGSLEAGSWEWGGPRGALTPLGKILIGAKAKKTTGATTFIGFGQGQPQHIFRLPCATPCEIQLPSQNNWLIIELLNQLMKDS